jgi:hypothetical protein
MEKTHRRCPICAACDRGEFDDPAHISIHEEPEEDGEPDFTKGAEEELLENM